MQQVTIRESEEAKPRVYALSKSRTRLILGLIIAAGFLDVIDFSIVQVALPTIQTELVVSLAESQWIIGAYGLTLAGFLLLSGRAGDIYGQKKLFYSRFVYWRLGPVTSVANRIKGDTGCRSCHLYRNCLRDSRNDFSRRERTEPCARHLRLCTFGRFRCRVDLRRGPYRCVRLEISPVR